MAKVTFPDGSTVETEDSLELDKVLAVLTSNASPTVVNNTNPNLKNSQSIPSVDDFRKAYQDIELKKFLDFVKQEGSSGIISDGDFKLKTGKKAISGLGKRFRRITGGACLSKLIRKSTINKRYEIDQSAYNNLMQV